MRSFLAVRHVEEEEEKSQPVKTAAGEVLPPLKEKLSLNQVGSRARLSSTVTVVVLLEVTTRSWSGSLRYHAADAAQ